MKYGRNTVEYTLIQQPLILDLKTGLGLSPYALKFSQQGDRVDCHVGTIDVFEVMLSMTFLPLIYHSHACSI